MVVIFRIATFNDQEGIKTLSKGIYNGSDTLNYDFTQWLKSDMWFLFVGEVNSGKIIAFTAINITDGGDSLVVRSSRVDAEYRGQGVYKALVNFAFQYVRERRPQAKYAWRLKSAKVRVPGGYDIIKRIGLLTTYVEYPLAGEIAKSSNYDKKVECVTWNEFKMAYNSEEAVRNLFSDEVLQINWDIFRLDCEENWNHLGTRRGVNLMLTKYEDEDGKAKVFMSFFRWEECFTNLGVPVVTMNLYGLDPDILKCHIAKGLQKALAHFHSKFLTFFWIPCELFEDCASFLREMSLGDFDYADDFVLLFGDSSKTQECR